jgi:uncharacterized membrane protein YkgB
MAQNHCIPPSVLWLNRLSLFVIFFWFGALKVFSASPAESLITHLHQLTLYKFVSIHSFLITLGIIECAIGILWLIPSVTKIVIIIFTAQMVTTFLPLIILPGETWHNIMILSLPGQYILKNIVLVSSAFTIYKDCQVQGWTFSKISFVSFSRYSRHR